MFTNNFIPFIHNCNPIEVILEKCRNTYIWSLYNSNYALSSNILRLSLQNVISTLDENVRYLVHKYEILVTRVKIYTYCTSIVKLNCILIA